MEWRPICDAPKIGYVDLWIDAQGGYREADCFWDKYAKPDGCWSTSNGRLYELSDYASHFMIPEPPKKNGE